MPVASFRHHMGVWSQGRVSSLSMMALGGASDLQVAKVPDGMTRQVHEFDAREGGLIG